MNKNSLFMNNKFRFFIIFVMISFSYQLICIHNISANVYSIPFYASNGSSIVKFPTIAINNVNFNEITLDSYCMSYISSAGLSTCSFLYPFNNLITTSSSSSYGSCYNMGRYEYGNLQSANNIESGFSLSSSAGSYLIKPEMILKINSNSDNITFMQNYTKDTLNYVKNLFSYDQLIVESGITQKENLTLWVLNNVSSVYNNNVTQCLNHYFESSALNTYHVANCNVGTFHDSYYFIRFLPINSSYNGKIVYNITGGEIYVAASGGYNNIWREYQIGYFQLGSNTLNILSATNKSAGTLNLNANTIYVLYIAGVGELYRAVAGVSTCDINEADYNTTFLIDIATPNWNCTNFGECILGVSSRLCHDLNGYYTDKVETQICYMTPEKSINLGFEDSKDVNVFYVQPTWWCFPDIAVKIIEYPNDWNVYNITNPLVNCNITTSYVVANTIGYPYDTLMMTTEDSKDGIKSLKIWTIPPEQGIPYCPETLTGYCIDDTNSSLGVGNYSVALYPQLNKDVNESYLIEKDMTFGYPNMTLSFYGKKCSSPIQEWSGNSSLFGFCGEGYYTNDKSPNHDIEDTNIFFYLYDYNTSEYVISLRTIISSLYWQKKEIRLFNISTSHLYRISMGVYTNIGDILLSSKNYCALIDDVEVNGYNREINCNSYCNESTYLESNSVGVNGCTFTEFLVSEKCKIEHETEILLCNPFCECDKAKSDYRTYYQGDNSTGFCEWTKTLHSSYCIEQCKTKQITKPTIDVEEISEKLSPFLSPIFLIMFVIVGIGAVLAYKIKSWEVFAIFIIVGFLVASTVWIEMTFIAICIMLVVAYFLAKEHGKPSG